MQTMELMNRLHELDAALASCQRRAINVDELRAVWDQHHPRLEGLEGSDHAWVDGLLRKVAERHGIAGMVQIGGVTDATASSASNAESRP